MKILKPIKGGICGCRLCGFTDEILPLDYPILAGFGEATIKKDEQTIYREPPNIECNEAPKLLKFEKMARKEPKCDWRFLLNLPLRSAEYQRQGRNKWILIKKGLGFA